jgi:aminoglycoside phosphotransferase
MAKQLKEPQYTDSHREMSTGFLGACVDRGLRRLAARGEKVVDPATVDTLQRRLGDIFNLMVDARSAEEPLAVVTHGDFCINNTMFKYDETTGKPIDLRLVDFQTSM